jgi:hypothetical protein
MQFTKARVVAIAIVMLLLSNASPLEASIEVADSINAADPAHGATFGVDLIGWVYTPSTSFDLLRVETKFATADSRTVTLEIYAEHSGSAIGAETLLRTATFSPLGGVFSGADVAPLSLISGEDYFIGFRGVQGLGNNFSSSFPNTLLPAWVDRDSAGSYRESATQLEFQSAILQLCTRSESVPELSSVLTWLSLAAMAVVCWRRLDS